MGSTNKDIHSTTLKLFNIFGHLFPYFSIQITVPSSCYVITWSGAWHVMCTQLILISVLAWRIPGMG